MEILTKNKLYEGMFLIDSSLAGSDWDGIISSIRKILEKVDAEIISIKKWDDRRLAYDIKGTSRGTYILSYFKVDGGKITDIEKSVHLSEKIMRVLILNAERLTQEDMEKDTPAMKQEKETEHQSPESRYGTHTEPRSYQRDMLDSENSEDFEEETDQDSEEATDESQASDFNTEPGVSTVSEDNTDEQSQSEQIEDYEQADKNEPL